ncbi:TPA: SMI1/KNR4 family protein [Photobacterium damselae]|uniref:SMI1/KNR4 family protein n=1 Tax=Photobacterium damselae TaxID=38293 RepID=UPI001594B19F|nr:SMI1/KNR4 family protein [Photobacterium damselae]NVH46698.1 SMI1/KNR4 family protein [Photobacterium damselae subsp. damselae]
MDKIREKLVSLGVNLHFLENESIYKVSNELPDKILIVIMSYRHSIIFENEIIYKPQYKTSLEDSNGDLSLETLWGLEDGNLNIFKLNDSLYHIGASKDYISIGESFGGNHVCLSKKDEGVYFFDHESEIIYKIFDSVDCFFDSLCIKNIDDKTKNMVAKSITLKF